MRYKVLIITAAILLFGVSFAVYAYNSTNQSVTETVAASCCCCTGDSCPMKGNDGKAMAGHDMKMGEGHSCCGDSCPMKAKGESAMAGHEMKAGEGHSCCGDSCPMKGKDGKAMAGHDMKMADGASCPMMKDGKMAEMHKGMDHEKMSADHKSMNHDAKAEKGVDGHSCPCSCCAANKEKTVTSAI